MTLKLKRTPGLYLVGFMACGKTTVGHSLAEELGWCFVDIDRDIENREGKAISDIFVEQGEALFRELETEMIRARVSRVESGEPCVFALGGGAFVQPKNWDLIENNGITVWLDCPFEIVLKRLGDDTTRPLAAKSKPLLRNSSASAKTARLRRSNPLSSSCSKPATRWRSCSIRRRSPVLTAPPATEPRREHNPRTERRPRLRPRGAAPRLTMEDGCWRVRVQRFRARSRVIPPGLP